MNYWDAGPFCFGGAQGVLIGAHGCKQGTYACSNAVSIELSRLLGYLQAFMRLAHWFNILERALYNRDGPHLSHLVAPLAQRTAEGAVGRCHLCITYSNNSANAMVIGLYLCTLMQVQTPSMVISCNALSTHVMDPQSQAATAGHQSCSHSSLRLCCKLIVAETAPLQRRSSGMGSGDRSFEGARA